MAGALEGSLLPESTGQTGRRTSQELTAPPLVGEEGVRGFKPQALQKLFTLRGLPYNRETNTYTSMSAVGLQKVCDLLLGVRQAPSEQ